MDVCGGGMVVWVCVFAKIKKIINMHKQENQTIQDELLAE